MSLELGTQCLKTLSYSPMVRRVQSKHFEILVMTRSFLLTDSLQIIALQAIKIENNPHTIKLCGKNLRN